MAETPEEVAALAERELQSIKDPVVAEALRNRILEPKPHLRHWDYGEDGEQLRCWTIALDAASDTAIVYSEHGFGPAEPWGVVSLTNLWFGMDSGWFRRLEDAFVESYLASVLPIWNVVAGDDLRRAQVRAESLTSNSAFATRDDLVAREPGTRFHVVYRSGAKEGVA
jgi:hypothetical protein